VGDERGIIYVATKHPRYVEEAFLSATSVKRLNPTVSITLFTDHPDHALCAMDCFDGVEAIASVAGFKSDWAEGQLNRLMCLARSPYAQTLNLDTDTRVLTREIGAVFDLLAECDVAMVEEDPATSYSCEQSSRRMFNAGFILYNRDAPRVLEWLNAWDQRVRRNFGLAMQPSRAHVPELAHVQDERVQRQLLQIDQIALMEILSPDRNAFGLRVRELSNAWNYRGDPNHAANPASGLKILHSTNFKNVTSHDILNIAHGWHESGQTDAAARLYDYVAGKQRLPTGWLTRLLRMAPQVPEEWATPTLRAADLHLRYGQADKASQLLDQAMKRFGEDAYALVGYARLALGAGRISDAIDLAAQGVQALPQSAYAAEIMGQSLLARGRRDEACAPLARAAQKGRAEASHYLSLAHLEMGRYATAVDACRRTLMLRPDHAGAANNMMPALLGARAYKKALNAAAGNLARRPWHVSALAFKCVALAELGRRDALDRMIPRELIDMQVIQPPADYATLADFNTELARALAKEPSLAADPDQHATRRGWHSGDLSQSSVAPVAALNALLIGIAQTRMRDVQAYDGEIRNHPFVRACPQQYRLHAWTVIMDEGGHQIPHIHAKGWLSGVYYVDVPEDIRADDPSRQGWLHFGRAEDRWHRAETQIPTHDICPSPGLLVTFPSFYWHGTRPTTTSRRRISYAFDIVPV